MESQTKFEIDAIPKEILKGQFAAYFESKQSAKPNPLPFTLPGLAMWIKIPLREFILYPETGPLYTVIQHAKSKCENDLIDRMYKKEIDRTTGLLFLKNHFGYLDIAKALSEEERKLKKKESLQAKRSISDILDSIEQKKLPANQKTK